MVPWVLEDIFVLSILMVRGEAESTRREAPREKNNLWPRELRVPFPCSVRIKYLTKPVWSWCACLFSLTLTAEIWSYVTLRLRCMTIGLRKSSLCYGALKVVTNSFPKNTLQVPSILKRQKSAEKSEKYTLCMFLEVNRIKGGPRHLYYFTRSTKYCQTKRLYQIKHHSAAFFSK